MAIETVIFPITLISYHISIIKQFSESFHHIIFPIAFIELPRLIMKLTKSMSFSIHFKSFVPASQLILLICVLKILLNGINRICYTFFFNNFWKYAIIDSVVLLGFIIICWAVDRVMANINISHKIFLLSLVELFRQHIEVYLNNGSIR